MVNILEVLDPEQLAEFKEQYNGTWKGPCPSCSDYDGYGGSLINPETGIFYCFGSKTIFNIDEAVALFNGLISCREGRQKL